jgi:ATP-dependent helicase IRC3
MTTTATLQLRDYQAKCQADTVKEFLTPGGSWRLVNVIPTAGGKTVTFSTLSQYHDFQTYLKVFPPTHRKTLVIAHREELLDQAKEKFETYCPGLRVEIEQADRWASPQSDVIIASIQTLAGRSGNRLKRIDPATIRLIIIDECHHATACSYVSVLQYFQLLPPDAFMPKTEKMDAETALEFQRERLAAWDNRGKPPCLLLGVTATPRRSDRVGLEAVFQKIAFEETILNMIRRGYLSRPRALRIVTNVNLDPVHTSEGDFDQQELAEAVRNVERNRCIVKGWLAHASDRRATIVFCVNVQHAIDLAEEFNAQGISAAAIHANSKDRKELLGRFRAGELKVMTNVGVLSEGTDIPEVDCIIPARPTKSALVYTQWVGRGMRLCPETGKIDCLILDVVDVTTRHSLVTAPTLIGLPAEYDAKGFDLVEQLDKVEELKKANPLLDTSKAKSLDDLEVQAHEVDLFGAFNDPEMVENSRFAWMKVDDHYQIRYPGKVSTETLMVSPNQFGGWNIEAKEFGKPYQVAPATDSLDMAFKRAEKFLGDNYPGQVRNVERNQPWRKSGASPGQKAQVERLAASVGIPVDTSQLKSGEASNLIEIFKTKLHR